jgi:DNA-binding NtrC family response regulator
MTTLIVSESVEMRNLLAIIADEAGLSEIITVTSSEVAIDNSETIEFSCVIIDSDLPLSTETLVLINFHKNQGHKTVLVSDIAIFGDVGNDIALVDAFLQKPFDAVQFVELLKRIV